MMKYVRMMPAIGVALWLLAGCGGEMADPPVVMLEGTQLTLSQVEADHDRIHQEDWAQASYEARKEFVDLVAKREVILHHAKVSAGNELAPREQVIYDRWVDKLAMQRFWPKERQKIPLPPGMVDSLAAEMVDERFISYITCVNREDADTVYAELLAGGDFTEVGTRWGESHPTGVVLAVAGWLNRPSLPGNFRDIVYDIPGIGQVSVPTQTMQMNWVILHLDSLRTVPAADQMTAAAGVADRIYRDRKMAELNQEVAAQYEFELITENLGPIKRHFAALYDSVKAAREAGHEVDYQGLMPPLHRFTAEERRLPLMNWINGVYTIEDFVRSLFRADLDYWPTVGPDEKIATQIERRMNHWAMIEEAIKRGMLENPGYKAEAARRRNHLFLEMYEKQNLSQSISRVTPEMLRPHWERHRGDYLSKDLVGYGFLRFPADLRDLAESTAEELQRGMSWEDAADLALKADVRVLFQPGMDAAATGTHPGLTGRALQYELGPEGAATYSDALEIDGEWVILRIHYRQHPHELSFEEAREQVEHDLMVQALEADLTAQVDELSARYGLQVDHEVIRPSGQ